MRVEPNATPERPIMRMCCACPTIYGCYDGVNTKDCALCPDVVICYAKFLYEKEPFTFPTPTSGLCNGCFELKMQQIDKGRTNRLLPVADK